MKKNNMALVAVVGVALALGASPAFAEGSWNSRVVNARPGFDSRSWQDSRTDNKRTAVTLKNCVYGNAKGLVKSVGVRLYAEWGWLPDQDAGTKTQNCGTYNFGKQNRKDRYHWNVFSIVNSTSKAHTISSDPVSVEY